MGGGPVGNSIACAVTKASGVLKLADLQVGQQEPGLLVRLQTDVFKNARPDFCLEQLLVQLHCLPGT